MSTASVPSSQIDIIRGILRGEDPLMPKKYQNPTLETRTDVSRPFYFIRVAIPKMTEDGPKRRRVVRILGFVNEISKKEAMLRRSRELDAVNAGRVVVQCQIRFSDIVKRYLDIRVPQLGVASQNKHRTQIAVHILPAFGKMLMHEIDRPTVESWLASKSEMSWWSRTDMKSVLSKIFLTAKDWKLWDGDMPTHRLRIGRKKLAREKRLLSVEDLRRLFSALPERPRFIVTIMFGLGLSISETLGLRWSDIDMPGQTIKIQRRWYRGDLSEEGETKTEARNATLALSPSLVAEFQQRYPGPHKRGEFLFIGDDGHTPPDDRDMLREEFRPVVKRLGLYYKGFGWHAFRRQNITWRQTVGGATALEAQKGARHATLDMTLLYTLTDNERESAQQQAMFDHLIGLPGSGPKQ